jgi:hypothetical protein
MTAQEMERGVFMDIGLFNKRAHKDI